MISPRLRCSTLLATAKLPVHEGGLPRHYMPGRGQLEVETAGTRVSPKALKQQVLLVDHVGDLPDLVHVLSVAAHIMSGERETRKIAVMFVVFDACQNLGIRPKYDGDNEPATMRRCAELCASPILDLLHGFVLANAVLMAQVPRRVDDDHANTLADGSGQLLVVL